MVNATANTVLAPATEAALLAVIAVHERGYAAFAASMLAAEAKEIADIARINARSCYVSATADNTAATVRPSR